MLRDDEGLNPPRDGDRVAAQGILPYPGLEESNSPSPRPIFLFALSLVEFGERSVDRACATVKVLVLGFLCYLRQNLIDEFVDICSAITPGDYINGNIDTLSSSTIA